MEVHNRWYDDTAKAIESYKDTFSQKEAKRYKLDFLLRVTGRVDQFDLKESPREAKLETGEPEGSPRGAELLFQPFPLPYQREGDKGGGSPYKDLIKN